MIKALKTFAADVKRNLLIVYFAISHPQTPSGIKFMAILVTAYAFSPIDLIPDFIPVVGLIDDLILLPVGIALVMRMLPPAVLKEARAKATQQTPNPTSRLGAVLVVSVWIAVGAALFLWLYQPFA